MAANCSPFKIILGSSSIARRKILAEMGYDFTIMTADIDEKSIRKENPEDLVVTLAEAKADAIVSKLQTFDNQNKDDKPTILIAADTAAAILPRIPTGDHIKDAEPTLLITADQVVVYEGVIREKPSSKEEARQFMKDYSGGQAATVSSVFISNLKTGLSKGDWDRVEEKMYNSARDVHNVVQTKIYFHEIPDEVIEKLIEEGTVLNVAGGLIIEHPLILPLIKKVLGTTDSVMGLPKALTERLLKEVL